MLILSGAGRPWQKRPAGGSAAQSFADHHPLRPPEPAGHWGLPQDLHQSQGAEGLAQVSGRLGVVPSATKAPQFSATRLQVFHRQRAAMQHNAANCVKDLVWSGGRSEIARRGWPGVDAPGACDNAVFENGLEGVHCTQGIPEVRGVCPRLGHRRGDLHDRDEPADEDRWWRGGRLWLSLDCGSRAGAQHSERHAPRVPRLAVRLCVDSLRVRGRHAGGAAALQALRGLLYCIPSAHPLRHIYTRMYIYLPYRTPDSQSKVVTSRPRPELKLL